MRQPVLFIGHGSPMNALANNNYTQALNQLAKELTKPKAILCISAHWMTEGTAVTHSAQPQTIHDFFGFPQELFQVQYPAPGDPELAEQVSEKIPDVRLDEAWGLDHGTWSVLRHIYPRAEVPVVQLSLNLRQPPEFHFQLGEKLRFLRDQDVLILGSGNIVHNLRKIQWDENAPAFQWAEEFDAWVKECLIKRDHMSLVHSFRQTEAGQLSVPTLEHYLPLLYILGASQPDDKVSFPFEGLQNASISMRSLRLG